MATEELDHVHLLDDSDDGDDDDDFHTARSYLTDHTQSAQVHTSAASAETGGGRDRGGGPVRLHAGVAVAQGTTSSDTEAKDGVSFRDREAQVPSGRCCNLLQAKWYLVFLSMFAFGQSMVISGIFPVSITSITRQLGYTNAQVGALPSLYDAVIAVTAIFVTHLGHRAHKPRWCAYAAIIFTLGAITMAIPGIAYKPTFHATSAGDGMGAHTDGAAAHHASGNALAAGVAGASSTGVLDSRSDSGSNGTGGSGISQLLCSLSPRQDACALLEADYSLGRILFFVFVLGECLMAFGASPIYNLGVSFMDDNVDPDKSSLYIAIMYSCTSLGPAIGFLLGGVFLDTYVTLGKPPAGTDPESATWIGAWWLGMVVAASVTATSVPFLFTFPSRLPGTEWIRRLRTNADNQGQREGADSSRPSVSPATHGRDSVRQRQRASSADTDGAHSHHSANSGSGSDNDTGRGRSGTAETRLGASSHVGTVFGDESHGEATEGAPCSPRRLQRRQQSGGADDDADDDDDEGMERGHWQGEGRRGQEAERQTGWATGATVGGAGEQLQQQRRAPARAPHGGSTSSASPTPSSPSSSAPRHNSSLSSRSRSPRSALLTSASLDAGSVSQGTAPRPLSMRSPLRRAWQVIKSTWRSLLALLSNHTFTAVSIGTTLDGFIVGGIGTFLPAFVETQFHVSSADASFYSGLAIIVGVTSGTMAGGFVVRKLNLTARQTSLATVVFSIITVLFMSMFLVTCSTLDVAGVNVPYMPPPSGTSVANASGPVWAGCDPDCHCSLRDFRAVCHRPSGITFFTPCAAGCTVETAVTGAYANCSCVPPPVNTTTGPPLSPSPPAPQPYSPAPSLPASLQRALRAHSNSHSNSDSGSSSSSSSSGPSPAGNASALGYDTVYLGRCKGDCHSLPGFLALLFAGMLFLFMASVPVTQVHLRCVAEEQRSLALGVSQAISRLFGAVPGPVIVGALLDRACILWEERCDDTQGSCLQYDNPAMARTLGLTTLIVKTASVVAYWWGWYKFPRSRDVSFQSHKHEVIVLQETTESVA